MGGHANQQSVDRYRYSQVIWAVAMMRWINRGTPFPEAMREMVMEKCKTCGRTWLPHEKEAHELCHKLMGKSEPLLNSPVAIQNCAQEILRKELRGPDSYLRMAEAFLDANV